MNLTGIHACVTLVVVHGVASLFDARDGFYLGSQTSLDSKVVHSVLWMIVLDEVEHTDFLAIADELTELVDRSMFPVV